MGRVSEHGLMPDYIADAAADIAKRLKEIQSEEGFLTDADIDRATGRNLRLLANQHNVPWTEDTGDFALRTAIKNKLGL